MACGQARGTEAPGPAIPPSYPGGLREGWGEWGHQELQGLVDPLRQSLRPQLLLP